MSDREDSVLSNGVADMEGDTKRYEKYYMS